MNIAFDVDGVFTDFEWFMDVYGKHFFKKGVAGSKKSTSVAERFGYEREYDKRFYLFYLVWYARKFPIRENAAETIRNLKKQGHKIYIITARALTEKDNVFGRYMRSTLKKWLHKNGVQYDGIYFCSTKDSAKDKVEWCRKLQIDAFVEDDPKNIEELKKECKIICVSADYNQNLEEVEYAVDFHEIYDGLCRKQDAFRKVPLEKRKHYTKEEQVEYCVGLRNYYNAMPFDKERYEAYVEMYLRQVKKFYKLAVKLLRVRLAGTGQIRENAIYVCNHTSLLDIPLCYCALHKVFARALTKRELEETKLNGYLRKMGFIFLDRESEKSGKIVRNGMINTLLNGGSVCLFPEGTRNKEKQGLLPFKLGAVYMAQVTGLPIIPFVINRAGKERQIIILDEFYVAEKDDLVKKNEELRKQMLEVLVE